MIRKLAIAALLLTCAGGLAFWVLTVPNRLGSQELAAFPEGDAKAGERIFYVGGCSSCHDAPGSKGDEKLRLTGGRKFATAFGTFVAPNISSDAKDGIGAWSLADFSNALKRGVSPEGAHYYPAFPYTSYARMTDKDVSDLYAFMKTLPAISGGAPDHEVGFPFNIRRGLGLWKLFYLNDDPVIALPADADQAARTGQYLVEGPGHCGECHTPRNPIGGMKLDQWLAGAPVADGEGKVPDITPGKGGIGSWSGKDIAYYLESGFTPEFDSVGGAMVSVQENMAALPAEYRDAIAAYLKVVPPKP